MFHENLSDEYILKCFQFKLVYFIVTWTISFSVLLPLYNLVIVS